MSAMLEELVVEVKAEPVLKVVEEAQADNIEEEKLTPLITKDSESAIDFKYPPEVKLRNKKKNIETVEDLEAKKKAEEEKRAQRRQEIEAEEARRLQEDKENEILYKNLPESER